MFGLVTPCRHSLPERLHRAWAAHLCGLCLTLRDRRGHAARMATNVDAVLVSVLVAAQRPDLATTRRAGACALRGMRPAEVIRSDAPAARLAGGVSLLLAGGMLRDHAADGDLSRPVRPVASRLGGRWESAGRRHLAEVGLDATALTGVADRARRAEHGTLGAGSLLTVTAPTEEAVSAALAHTARLAGRPGNEEPLARAGRLLGRVAHLTDALVDRADDDRHGRWNPLTASGAPADAAVAAIEAGLAGVRREVDLLDLPGYRPGAAPEAVLQADLARRLLGETLPRSVRRVLARAGLTVPAACRTGRGHRDGCTRGTSSELGGPARASESPWGDPGPVPVPGAPEPPPGFPGAYPPAPFPGAPYPPAQYPAAQYPPGMAPPGAVPADYSGESSPVVGRGCFSRCCDCGECCECCECGECCCECGDCCDCCDC